MREINLSFSVPQFAEEKASIQQCAQLMGTFLDLCDNSPQLVVESELRSFFDTYRKLENIQIRLSRSKWAHAHELGKSANKVLEECKTKFDDLGICVNCEYREDNIQKLKGFEQIRRVL